MGTNKGFSEDIMNNSGYIMERIPNLSVAIQIKK